jgi:hypothetical protein
VRPTLAGVRTSINRPATEANFTIPPAIMNMIQNNVQFSGLADEDPSDHIQRFVRVCDTFKIQGMIDDAIKLRLFPFSLSLKASGWLNGLTQDSITTWEDLANKFLLRNFPPAKTAKLRVKIHAFQQDPDESFYEAWERFKQMIRKCPYHALELHQ